VDAGSRVTTVRLRGGWTSALNTLAIAYGDRLDIYQPVPSHRIPDSRNVDPASSR